MPAQAGKQKRIMKNNWKQLYMLILNDGRAIHKFDGMQAGLIELDEMGPFYFETQ